MWRLLLDIAVYLYVYCLIILPESGDVCRAERARITPCALKEMDRLIIPRYNNSVPLYNILINPLAVMDLYTCFSVRFPWTSTPFLFDSYTATQAYILNDILLYNIVIKTSLRYSGREHPVNTPGKCTL